MNLKMRRLWRTGYVSRLMAFYRAGLITLAAFTLLIAAEIGLMADPDALALGGGDLLGEGFALD